MKQNLLTAQEGYIPNTHETKSINSTGRLYSKHEWNKIY